jgi:membrane protein YqaA with SNARE-associated domain
MSASTPTSSTAQRGPLGWVRALYDWVLSWADTPHGLTALMVISAVESIFFPIPPDVLLIAMTLGARERWARLAFACTIASVVGGLIGYALGATLWEQLSATFYQLVPGFSEAKFNSIKALYERWDFWVVFTAGFTPIPFKVITVSAGACGISLPIFIVASILSRGARFFLVAKLLHVYGAPMRDFIERRFNLLTIALTVALIGGFAALKLLF